MGFRDSVLWECLYEGLGTYRSMSTKWQPVNGQVSPAAQEALARLEPIFVEKIIQADSLTNPTKEQMHDIRHQLSRGPFHKKWGALTVGLWLNHEAQASPDSLVYWINRGPEGIIDLAKKRLNYSDNQVFKSYFQTKAQAN